MQDRRDESCFSRRHAPGRCGAGDRLGLTVTSSGLAEDVTATPLRIDGGHIEVPEQPGLGIDVDENRLRRRQQEFKRVA